MAKLEKDSCVCAMTIPQGQTPAKQARSNLLIFVQALVLTIILVRSYYCL